MTTTPSDRIRTLLSRADNVLRSSSGDEGTRARRARQALEEARDLARDPGVDAELRGRIDERLQGLGA
jgi:hypothetical protein